MTSFRLISIIALEFLFNRNGIVNLTIPSTHFAKGYILAAVKTYRCAQL